jgi:UMF1 family MFS transporter
VKNDKLKKIFDSLKFPISLPAMSWALYDLANTSFAVVIITLIFPVFFTSVVASQAMYPKNFGDMMWGLSSGISMLLTSICAPIFGAIADTTRSKNKFLIILTLMCIFFCSLLYFLKEGMLIEAMILFILANFFYQTSMMFYNSFLPQLSSKNNTGKISGFGFSLGYIGGFITLIIIYPFVREGLDAQNLGNIKLTFLITSLFFLIFSLPSFIFLKDLPARKETKINTSYVTHGFRKLVCTLKNIKKYKNLLRFLISYFLFSNAFSVFALFVAIYAKNTLNLSLPEIITFAVIGNIATIISSLFFGWLTDRIGPKTTINITLVMWIIIILIATTIITKSAFYVVWILASAATGSTLIASRSLMSFLIPVDSEAEFFGFYSISGKFSAILGPIAFGLISYITKSQRAALSSTLLFLIGGLIVLQFVKVPAHRETNNRHIV